MHLPPSLIGRYSGTLKGSPNVNEIFVAQDFAEIDQGGRRLNKIQRAQLRDFGQFDVDSNDFPGQHHTWKIAKCLQQGKINLLRDLKLVSPSTSCLIKTSFKNFRNALAMLVVGSKNRFVGDVFSAKVAAFAFLDFLRMIFG